MSRTLVWRGLDAPRMEVAHVDSFEHARGTQIGLAYELRWALERATLRVEVVGRAERTLELGRCDFFDLGYSPFFNSLPVMRDALLGPGAARDYTMRFVRVPELTDERARQRYEPLGDGVVRYRSGGFQADIEFGPDGFVDLYHGFLERVA